ncbi:MAG: alpha/beta fold hydrolase [Burkholderiaceae bacterium]|nr:alpha/beta fold hydrolase [Burkholderiaceae bacterium]
MKIRLAGHDDLSILAAVERDAAVLFRQVGLDSVADGDTLDVGYLVMLVDQETLWVAVDNNDQSVGFLAAQPLDGLLHIVELSVASGYQRRGLGSLLIEQAIQHGRQHGFPSLTLTTYRHLAWNAPLYSKRGFIEAQASQLGPKHLTVWNNDALAGHGSDARCMMIKSMVPGRSLILDQNNDNQLLHYQTYGRPDKPALVLVFGLNRSCADWHQLGYIEQLKKDFYIISLDLRGHGNSAKLCFSDDYSLPAMVADIERVIAYLNLHQPLLWGYSLGAKVVLATAAKCPPAYAGLVLGGFDLQAQATWPPVLGDPSTLHIPILLYAGEHCFFRDSTKALEAVFPASSYIELAGNNHFQVMAQSKWITEEVIALFA